MKFLSVRSDICRQLPSDSTSRWTPLPLTMQFPLLGLARDFHPLANAHAERTPKSGHWDWLRCPLFHISFLANWLRTLDSPLITKAKMISFIMVYFHNDLIAGQLLVGHLESERRVFCPIAVILLDQSLGTSAQLAAHWCHKARATSSKLRRVDSTS